MRRTEDPYIPTFLSDRSIAHHLSRQDIDAFMKGQTAFVKKYESELTSAGFELSDPSGVKKAFQNNADSHNKLHAELISITTLTDELVNNRHNILIDSIDNIDNIATGLKNLNEEKRDVEILLRMSNRGLPNPLKGTLEEHCGHGKD